MGYLSNFNIGASVDSSCQSIEITDNNSYPVTLDASARARTDLGIAIFWSLDSFSTVKGGDLNNTTNWFIPDIISGTYTIRAYAVPIWTSKLWAINSIVHDANQFYIATGATSTRPNAAADGGADWTQLTTSDHATFETHLYTASVINYGYATMTEYADCIPYTINKTSAGKYTIEYTSSATFKTLSITYYNGDDLATTYTKTLLAATTSYDVDISSEGDAVFIFSIEEVGLPTYEYIVYEISAMASCASLLTQQVLVLCDDGCLDSCLNTDQAIEVNLRNELNKLHLLYLTVLSKINVESITYLGIYTIDNTRQAYINEIGDLIEKVNSIVESCGNCS